MQYLWRDMLLDVSPVINIGFEGPDSSQGFLTNDKSQIQQAAFFVKGYCGRSLLI